jgi:DNA-binding IclR family transcriptional regulator
MTDHNLFIDRILTVLNVPEGLTIYELAQRLGLPQAAAPRVRGRLARLLKQGRVERVDHGRYRAVRTQEEVAHVG